MITKILWAVIIGFAVLSIFIGAKETLRILFPVTGAMFVVVGSLSIVSDRFDRLIELKVRSQFETSFDKKLFSQELGHFISRYLGGLQMLTGGIGIIFLYLVIKRPEIFNVVSGLFSLFN